MIHPMFGFPLLLLALQAPSGGAVNRIEGRVIDASTSAPLAGVRVTATIVRDVRGGTFGFRPMQTTTGADGRFEFDGLEAAQYMLTAERTGYARYPQIPASLPPPRITIESGRENTPIEIALQRGAVLTGRVKGANGEPEEGLDVTALLRVDGIVFMMDFVPAGSDKTNDIGEFRIAGLRAGDYRILATRRDFRGPDMVQTRVATTLAPTYLPGTADASAARIVTVQAGDTVTALDFTAVAVSAYMVSGVAFDPDGNPSPRAMVMLMTDPRAGSLMPSMTMADEQGQFVFGGVVPGVYRINAQATQGGSSGLGAVTGAFATFTDIGPDGARVAAPGTITVSSADVSGVKVTVSAR